MKKILSILILFGLIFSIGCINQNYEINDTSKLATSTAVTENEKETVEEIPPNMPSPAYVLVLGPKNIDAPGDDNLNLNAEWVSISCTRGTVDLVSWKMMDDYGWTFVFPKVILYEGDTVTIYTGCGKNTDASLFWCHDNAIWNNSGDKLYLYKPDGSLYRRWNLN